MQKKEKPKSKSAQSKKHKSKITAGYPLIFSNAKHHVQLASCLSWVSPIFRRTINGGSPMAGWFKIEKKNTFGETPIDLYIQKHHVLTMTHKGYLLHRTPAKKKQLDIVDIGPASVFVCDCDQTMFGAPRVCSVLWRMPGYHQPISVGFVPKLDIRLNYLIITGIYQLGL